MSLISRRAALGLGTARLLSLSFAAFLARSAVASEQGVDRIGAWLQEYKRAGDLLAHSKISQRDWQTIMDDLFNRLSLRCLCNYIDYDRIAAELSAAELGTRGEIFHTIAINGELTQVGPSPEPSRVLVTKVAHVRKGRSIPPHGHGNMVSAFLQLSGEMHVRQYDRIGGDSEHMLVRPARDFVGGAGSWSSVSDEKNNVHWLSAKSDDCFLFTTKMLRLSDDQPVQGRINIDVLRARHEGDGVLRAPHISHAEAAERY